MTNLPTPYAAARIAAFLDDHLCWSAYWDKHYGLWRVAEDDPHSDLYAESRDPDVVIRYISAHSRDLQFVQRHLAGGCMMSGRRRCADEIPQDQAAVVGANVRALRQQHGWNQAKLGELMGWPSNSTVCAAEGRRDGRQRGFTIQEVKRLAAIFGVSPSLLTTRCANCGGHPPTGFACLTCGARPRSLTGDHDVVDVGAGKAMGTGVVLERGHHPALGLDRREPGHAGVLHELERRVVRRPGP